MKTDDVPPPWGEYLRLQAQLGRSTRVNHRSRGMDEALTEIVERIATGGQLESGATIANLVDNRSLKYRQRWHIERQYRADLGPVENAVEVVAVLAHTRAVARVRAAVRDDDWDLLQDLAEGEPFGAIADARHASVSTLRSRACRIRKHLREGELGDTLLEAVAA